MAWNYKKRVEVAPGVFLNIVKHGVGSSAGVRSSSVAFGKDGAYVNTGVPGTGIYKRGKSGFLPQKSSPKEKVKKPASGCAYIGTGVLCLLSGCLFVAVGGAVGWITGIFFFLGVWAMSSRYKQCCGTKRESVLPDFIEDAKTELSQSADVRHRRILQNFLDCYAVLDKTDDEMLILEELRKKPGKNSESIVRHEAELASLNAEFAAVQYDADAELSESELAVYGDVCSAFEKLMDSQKIWMVIGQERSSQIKASAGTLVKRVNGNLFVGVFDFLKSRYDVPIFNLEKCKLYLYPKFAVLAESPAKFSVVGYDGLSVNAQTIRFQEEGQIPTDAEVVGSSWQYVNKNGTPDKRFVNNRQIPVVAYGELMMQVPGYGAAVFQFSDASAVSAFGNAFGSLSGKRPASSSESAADTEPMPPFNYGMALDAADKLYSCLEEMNRNRQVSDALQSQRQLDAIDGLKKTSRLNNRLAIIAAKDIVRCFDALGHSGNSGSNESLALGIILTRIMLPDSFNLFSGEQTARASHKITENLYNLFENEVQITFAPDKLLLIEMLRQEGVDEDVINRFAVSLYRFFMIIANADNRITKKEKDWLAKMLDFSTRGLLPAECPDFALDDELLTEAAEFVVKYQTAAASSIQRYFSVGYNRAGRILDALETLHIVSSPQSGKRSVLLPAGTDVKRLVEDAKNGVQKPGDVKPSRKPKIFGNPKLQPGDPMKELDALIGLNNVKTEVSKIYNLIKIQKIREEKGLKSSAVSYHCVFTGNPGTGKTTVARLVARIYKELGILEKGHLVETDRSGLVAEYVGQTAVKTNKIIDSALDGVLFIDEAYSLVQGGNNDFGIEAVATLLKRMEDDRDRLVVILAGYSEEMKRFIDSNPGLQSRFNRYVCFEDYSAGDLAEIYAFNLSKYDYKISSGAESKLREVLERAVAAKDKNFGNARFVRNLFEKTLENQARRLSSVSELTADVLVEIKMEDIPE